MKRLLILLTLVGSLCAQDYLTGKGGEIFPRFQNQWRVRGAGVLASRPATCTANRDVWVCNGAGCSINGEIHYCTATNTWTVGGSVGGGGSLATANAMVYVASAGVLDEDTELVRAADLLTVSKATKVQNATDTTTAYQWLDANGGAPILNIDSTNERVCIGCNAPTSALHVSGALSPTLQITDTTTPATFFLRATDDSGFIGSSTTHPLYFQTDNATRMAILATGEVGFGPGNIAPTGTADFLDRTATTGATEVKIGWDGTNASATTTELLVRAGATQGATPIASWYTSAGQLRLMISSQLALTFGSAYGPRWSNAVAPTGTIDLGLSRNAAGNLEIHSGQRGIGGLRDTVLRDLEAVDISSLAAESLTDPGFPNGANWANVGDFAVPAGTAVYTDSANSGTLTQTSAQMAIAGVANRWYVLTYTISSQSGDPACTITTAFAGSAETLTIADGAQTNYFQSAAAPANYIISCTSSSGGFTMDNMSLKEVIGGDITVNGDAHIKSLATYNGQATAGVGQPYILGNVATTGLTAAVGATNIVASAAAGMYRVSGYMQTTTQAAGACTSDVDIGWTYNSDAKALEVVSNHDQEVDETYSEIPTTVLRSDGAANITYTISLDAGGDCTNAVYDAYLVAERIQ